jgi:hypothetical protein
MKLISRLPLSMALLACMVGTPAFAGNSEALFVNLTTDDSHRASMAITFGQNNSSAGIRSRSSSTTKAS